MTKPGMPLPTSLSGEIVERTVKIDRSLIPIVSGALEWITDYQRYEQTGTYTVEQARVDLADMLYFYFSGQTSGAKMYAGMMMLWASQEWTLPAGMVDDGWLSCFGDEVLIADYPDLYAAIGDIWTNGAETPGYFRLPSFEGQSPMGAVAPGLVGASGGNDTATLAVGNLPAHTHNILGGAVGGAANVLPVIGASGAGRTAVTASEGSGTPFSIVHPVRYTHFIIMSKNP